MASSNVGGCFHWCVLPYISDISMCRPKRYGFWVVFGLKTGIDFHFDLESRVWFARKLRECLNIFTVSISKE